MSLITLLREGAARAPDQPLVLTPDRSVSYAECLERSEAMARGLRARAIERFACVVAHPVEVLALLCASTAVSSEACLYPADIDEALIDDYLDTFEQKTLITDRPLRVSSAEAISVEELPASNGPLPPPQAPFPTLILTTGTTGRHRGVRHDWARLVNSVRRSDAAPGSRWLLAYNLNQFAGTQILLHVLTTQATLVVPLSSHARDAVAAVREQRVTHASATPTFWRLFVAHLDPSEARALPLQQITLGGEAIPSSLLESLRQLFPRARISQIYAGTEFGSVGSVRDRRSGLPVSMLERGADAVAQVRIEAGELYVRSRTGMLGYYGEPDVQDEWLPTGDLVKIEGDRIVFVGRTSDTINVGGVKVHPLPVEEAAGAVEGVAVVRAYGYRSAVMGQIVALDVVLRRGADRARVEEGIREACNALPAAAHPRRIHFVDQIDVRGHKIVRSHRE